MKHEDYSLIYMPLGEQGKRKVSIMVPKMKLFFCFFYKENLIAHPGYTVVNLTTEETIVA